MAQMLGRTKEESLFDDAAGYESAIGLRFAPGLSLEEKKRAALLYNLFNELWGVIIVKGDPGTGKDLFGNYLQWNLKRWFPWKRMLRDERPRSLFGDYDGLFNEQVIADDLGKMRAIAKGTPKAEVSNGLVYTDALEKAAEDWVKGTGEVLLKNSVLYLTEYWRYCYNREPHNPMNKTMGAIQKTKRHLDMLVIGTTQLVEELDKKTALPWIDWRVICTHSKINPTGFTYFVERVKYDKRMDMLTTISARPFPISFDAGKPRSEMGVGKIVIKKPTYHPETEEERIVLDVLRAGVDKYEEIVELLETEGDMSERETLMTLKDLGLKLPGKRPKFVIWYPCYYLLYNSKSAPQLKTRLGVGG